MAAVLLMTATDTAAAALYVGGVEVTGTGAITGTGISGNVTFSYETGIGKALSRVPVLTLENATITEGYNVSTRIKAAIYADGITGLQIVLKGTNKLKVSSSSSSLNSTIGIALKDCGTVTMGNYAGNLVAHSITVNGTIPIALTGTRLNLQDASVTAVADAARAAIQGTNSSRLSVEHSNLNARSRAGAAISGLTSFSTTNCSVNVPYNGSYNTSTQSYETEDGQIAQRVTVETVKKYPLWVAGVQVTETNKDDLRAAVEASGNASFSDISGKTLDENCKMYFDETTTSLVFSNGNNGQAFNYAVTAEEQAIKSELGTKATLHVRNVGNNQLFIRSMKDIITSNSSLEFSIQTKTSWIMLGYGSGMETGASNGIVMSGAGTTLHFDNMTTSSSGSWGLRSFEPVVATASNVTLKVTNSELYFYTHHLGRGALTGFTNYECKFATLTGELDMVWDDEKKIFDSYNHYSDGARIVQFKANAMEMSIWVNGIPVTEGNYKDITGNGAVKSGKVYFDPTNNVLTLENARIEDNSNLEWNLIDIKENNVKVRCIGDNYLSRTGDAVRYGGLSFTSDALTAATIEGEDGASLTIESSSQYWPVLKLIGSGSAVNTIDNIKLTVTNTGGGFPAIHGGTGTSTYTTLKIKNSEVTASGTYFPMGGFKELTLEGCKCVSHEALNVGSNGKLWNGETMLSANAKLHIVPSEKYPVIVGGTRVTEDNYENIVPDGLTAGTISYSPTSNVLTVEDAVLTGSIETLDDVTVKFVGTCKIYANTGLGALISREGKMTLSGNDVNVNVTATEPAALYVIGAVKLSNLTGELNLRSTTTSVQGGSASATMEINNSDVTLNAISSSAVDQQTVKDMSYITLSNSTIYYPQNVTFNEEQKTFVYQNGNPVAGMIYIGHTGNPGDVNGDNEVDITDVVNLANHVMGETPELFVVGNADITGDGEVDITDVVQLANRVMGI